MDVLNSIFNALLDWLGHGFSGFNGWEIVAYTLVTTHITIAAVTIFLHRAQAHRALDLHPIPAHFFRFWLWLGSGMVTKEWVAIHRKHHAKCETEDDPHSPQTRGIKTVLLQGSELYRAEAKNQETLAKYGHGTPDDWLERNLYARFSWQGVGLMLIADLCLFGAIGATVWAVQMLWIPITAAGIINGIGHFWGYRNFEAPDASRNVLPWGIVIGGEELHNNHHTYPTSAKLSVKPHEFDIGWLYIRGLEMLGLAKVRKLAAAAQARRRQAGRRRQDARGDHRQPLRGDGEFRAQPAPRQPCRARATEERGRHRRAPGADARRAALAASRRRQDPARRQVARRRRAGVEPVPGQAGGDARGAAAAVDAHWRLRRAARRRPPGLAQEGRGKRHRRPSGVRAAPARRPRIADASLHSKQGVAAATPFRSAERERVAHATRFFGVTLRYFNFVSL